jgi:hypothetical protein
MINFSLKGRDSEVLRAFIHEHTLTAEEVDSGFVLNRGFPYTIYFDKLDDGLIILENLPMKVLVSFQTLQGGLAYAVVRILKERKEVK